MSTPTADRVPVRRLTLLYDAECSLCTFLRDWLVRQPQLVPLELLPAGSEQARRRFPTLDHRATLDDITVVGDAGQVYRSAAAWIVTLWALREHRPLAHRLSTPAGRSSPKERCWLRRSGGRAAGQAGVPQCGRVGLRPEAGLDVQRTRL